MVYPMYRLGHEPTVGREYHSVHTETRQWRHKRQPSGSQTHCLAQASRAAHSQVQPASLWHAHTRHCESCPEQSMAPHLRTSAGKLRLWFAGSYRWLTSSTTPPSLPYSLLLFIAEKAPQEYARYLQHWRPGPQAKCSGEAGSRACDRVFTLTFRSNNRL